MGKTIGLQQLAAKIYDIIELSEVYKKSIGRVESAFDAVIWGGSGNGKSSFVVNLITELILAMDCTCEYVAYEEGAGLTMQELMIGRNNLLEKIGNKLKITDHLTYSELHAKMGKRQSAKLWIIDSLQVARFTQIQVEKLKRDYITSSKRASKKIIIYISWSQGKEPLGAVAQAAKYNANIKMRVEGFVMFPISRYGGNLPFVIWEGDNTQGAKKYWGDDYNKVVFGTKTKPRKATPSPSKVGEKESEKATKIQIATPATKPLFNH